MCLDKHTIAVYRLPVRAKSSIDVFISADQQPIPSELASFERGQFEAQFTDWAAEFLNTSPSLRNCRDRMQRWQLHFDYLAQKGTYAMSILIRALLLLLVGGQMATSSAQDISAEDMRSLDGQVQEIKSDVLSIASELDNLEERLLFPSNTQIAVFVSMEADETFRLDAVKIAINGELATHHIYSFQELEALQKGGVQRIYTANVATGDHELSVTMMGKLKNGKDFNQSDSFVFAKGVEPKLLGITLAGPGLGGSGIQVGDW